MLRSVTVLVLSTILCWVIMIMLCRAVGFMLFVSRTSNTMLSSRNLLWRLDEWSEHGPSELPIRLFL